VLARLPLLSYTRMTSCVFLLCCVSAVSSLQTHEFYAGMTCYGCKNAVTRIITRIPGVSKLEADVATKRVLVTGTASKEVVEEKLNRWGQTSQKEVRYVKSTAH
jgi:copper chaperone CopZ